ncbi:MAG: carbohydrate ABC transporter permease [Fimbriimonadaceae bacterium]
MKRRPLDTFVTYVLLAVGALVLVLPFYYMVVTSVKPDTELAETSVSLIARHPTVKPYTDLIQGDAILRATWNSFVIAASTTLGSMLFCALAGYAFAKHRFPGRDALFLTLLATMMVPATVLLVPGFLLMRDFGWLDTWWPLIVPGMAGAFGVFLARQFMHKIPDSLIESAKLDGCGEVRVFRSIVLPNVKPLLATLGILTFLGSWNSFVAPLIMLLDEKKYPLPLVISLLQGRFPYKDNVQMAGAVISIAPVLLLFLVFQRQIVQSLAGSALKES